MAEVTYYFDLGGTSWTDGAYMWDGILTNYAYTSSSGDFQQSSTNGNTCPGTDLGTITKVEVRAYGYGDGNDGLDLWVTLEPYDDRGFVTMPGSADWSAYLDITTITDAPSPWTWADIVAPRVRVIFAKVGKGNTIYCAKVEIRVTYTTAGGTYYHGLKVQPEGELALCDVGTNPLRIRKGGTTYGIELVETDDPNASKVRIKIGTGIKAIRKYT